MCACVMLCPLNTQDTTQHAQLDVDILIFDDYEISIDPFSNDSFKSRSKRIKSTFIYFLDFKIIS